MLGDVLRHDAQIRDDLGGLGGNTVPGGLNKHGVVVGSSIGSGGAAHAVVFTPRKN